MTLLAWLLGNGCGAPSPPAVSPLPSLQALQAHQGPLSPEQLWHYLHPDHKHPVEKWRLQLDVKMYAGSARHLYCRADLLFCNHYLWDGWQLMLLQRQIHPAATLISYHQGFLLRHYFTDVRLMVAPQNMTQGLQYGKTLLRQWRQEHPALAAQPRRSYHPDILFFFTTPLAGHFYFLLDPKGLLPLDQHGQPLTRVIANQVRARYRWNNNKTPVSYHPHIYQALVPALQALYGTELPSGSCCHNPYQDRHAVGAVLKTLLLLNPALELVLPLASEYQIALDYQYRAGGPLPGSQVLQGHLAQCPQLLSADCALTAYQRQRVFTAAGERLADELKLTVRGQDQDYGMYFRLSLQHR